MYTKSLVISIFVICVTASSGVVYSLSCASASDKKHEQASKPEKTSISVKCRIVGRFSKGNAWSLEVQPDGAARLSIESYPQSKPRIFKVSAAQLAELGRVTKAQHFFNLGDAYGDAVPDGSTRTLTIVSGNRSKTVTLLFLRTEDPKLAEIKRAVRVWNTVRGWFHDKEAVDLRPYDQRLLDAP